MSSIEYRKRIAQRREAERRGNLTTFKGQTVQAVDSFQPEVEVAPPVDDVATEETAITIETPQGGDVQERQVGEVVDAPVETKTPAIVPQPESGMTPQELRSQAVETAKMLVTLDDTSYQESMTSLQESNPALYAVVVDELENLAVNAEDEEGDGYDLPSMLTESEPVQESDTPVSEDQEPEGDFPPGDEPVAGV